MKTHCKRGHERTPENLTGRSCKVCARARAAAHYKANREEKLSYAKERYRENPNKFTAATKAWRDKNPEKYVAWTKAYYVANRETRKAQSAKWAKDNSEYVAAYARKYQEDNREKLNTHFRAYRKNRYDNDPCFRVAECLRARMRSAIKNNHKAGSAVADLGCSIECFKRFLEHQFQEGMTWDNHGEWHIDHVKPLASFDLTDRKQFLEAANWTNHQPLWAEDNLRKGGKY